jgi:carbamoyltransferase
MYLLGINIGHNGSTALYKDSELIFYVEEERLTRVKYDGNPFAGIDLAFTYTDHVDFLIICSTSNDFPMTPWNQEDVYTSVVRKKQPGIPFQTVPAGDIHHMTHALTAFYNSGFDEAAALVIDGAGSGCSDEEFKKITWEVESIWSVGYPAKVECHYKQYGANHADNFDLEENGHRSEISDSHGLTKAYEAVTQFLGFHPIEAGKTMGLAPYGKPNDAIKINDGRFNNRAFIKPRFPAGNFIRADLNPELMELNDKKEWHNDESLVGDYRKDLAYAVQKAAEERVYGLIRKTIELTGKKKIVMAGGFGLNCVANYEYLKEFPDVEFYHEPISHDGGNAMGVCQHVYRSVSEDSTPAPLTSLYIGPMNEARYNDVDYTGFLEKSVTSAEVAQLIADGNIVTLYQGRSEAGPRALGNRSILFDPTVQDGKAIVNEVKRREWFRPFAGSVMAEHAGEWFDFRSRNDSPFMMYAVDVKEDKQALIPAITHVDGTCRIQTVTQEQNPHYYDLISEFNKIKNVPILFNTSFNLAGDPLVETVKQALETLIKSDLKYMWLPELGKLITKQGDFEEV